jgi:drug/metabolite transporter (DMT)-like permease
MNARPASIYLVLAAGIAVVSTAAILIRFAQAEGASSLLIASVRLGLAALILTIPVLHTQRAALRALSGRDLAWATLAGIALALHFASWIRSLEFTSVAASTVLVTTNPLWVAMASVLILRERLSSRLVAGIGLSLAGTLWIFLLSPMQQSAASGNLLALGGAVCMSLYLLIGRSLRTKLPLLTYVWLVYTIAALGLAATCIANGDSIGGLSPRAIGFMLALAVGPQLLGHTILNWAMRHVSATFVALAILGEPIGSALLALLLFGESMTLPQLLAYALILIGIVVSALPDRAPDRAT